LAGTYDYGPLGTLLKRNITNEWLKYFVDGWSDMYQIDSAILMNPKVWQASGHVDTFTDPLVECANCHMRFREDKIDKDKCPNCGKENTFGEARPFNMMFKTNAGPIEDDNSTVYLRPETAQGMFTNYKNILDSFYPDLPFGIAQVGKAFRNEISPRDFIFRTREFEIMEFEYFLHPDMWEDKFEKWRKDMHAWFKHLGLAEDKIKELEVPAEDRAHYSQRTIDFLYDFPTMGFDEIGGLAYRTDFDLKNHQEHSGKNLEYRPKDGSLPFIPHVIEPTFGVDRNFLAVLSQAYTEDEVEGEKRVFLKLPSHLAPVKVAVFPLLKNKPELVAKAKEVHKHLNGAIAGEVMWDDNGNIGKRYRRQDEIGTPYCITIDFDSLEDDTVTLRSRDTTQQERVKVKDLTTKLTQEL
jgi:glycyl-tRNA synthetase